MTGSLIRDYVAQGAAASRPAAPDAATNTLSFYYATDTLALSYYDWNAVGWVTITGSSLASTTEVLTGTNTTKAATPDAIAALWEKGSDIASAGTISVGEGGFFHVTGTTTITDIDFATDKAGRLAVLVFDGALTLTHNASTLILPTGANIITAAGDIALVWSEGSDVVRVSYHLKSGKSLRPAHYGAMVRLNADIAGDTTATLPAYNVAWDTIEYDTTWDPGDGGAAQKFWLGANFTFVDADVSVADNTITEASHGFETGYGPFRLYNTGGALPGGTDSTTKYWSIKVDANTFKLATSRANALAGTAVDITSAAGGGTHTCNRGRYLVVPAGVSYVSVHCQLTTESDLAGLLLSFFYKDDAAFVGSGRDQNTGATNDVNGITSAVVAVSEGAMFSVAHLGADAFTLMGGAADVGVCCFSIKVHG